ncbi:protein abrupt [Lasius niger]|uniref:Protein abrupt n=1 Tax=Lasius niger TaxID=67767 RepID=A0A0J7NH43_LASNI|nr:protein abrupt [Lasius niger]
MPSQFDPELASQLLAKAGVKVSPAELRARASPTAPRRSDMRLELPRGGAPSEAGSSNCGGDDPEDLTIPLAFKLNSPSPIKPNSIASVITRVSGSSNGSSNSKNSTTTAAIAAKSLDTMHDSREPNMAPLHSSGHHPGHNSSAIAGSALLNTYLQFIAENSDLTTIGLTPEHAVAMSRMAQLGSAKAQMSVIEKHGGRSLEDPYPIISRDKDRDSEIIHEDRDETMQDRLVGLVDDVVMSGGEDEEEEEEEYSENEEPEIVKSE